MTRKQREGHTVGFFQRMQSPCRSRAAKQGGELPWDESDGIHWDKIFCWSGSVLHLASHMAERLSNGLQNECLFSGKRYVWFGCYQDWVYFKKKFNTMRTKFSILNLTQLLWRKQVGKKAPGSLTLTRQVIALIWTELAINLEKKEGHWRAWQELHVNNAWNWPA